MTGFLSFFKSRREKSDSANRSIDIDLGTFEVGNSQIARPPAESDFFTGACLASGVYQDEKSGFEVGTKDGALDYIFLTIEKFPGRLLFNGTELAISDTTTEADICEQFGEPFLVDRSDGEIIMFYEYFSGTIELQFEFSDGKRLGFITVSQNGVLSNEEQRKSYGVEKPCPPE